MKENSRYWDSSCFLGWLKQEADKIDDCRGVIEAAKKGNLDIITSALTFVEVLYLKHRDPISKEDAGKVKRFFENEFIIPVNLDRDIAEAAQNIVWDYKIKPSDATHIATALQAGINIVDTFDQELIDKFNNQIGTPPLRIGKPNLPLQLELIKK